MGYLVTTFLVIAGVVNGALASVLVRSYLRDRGVIRTGSTKLVFGAHRH